MRVVIATDGSEAAGVGIELAAGIRWPAGTTIRVITALDTGPALFAGPWPSVALVQTGELKAHAEQTVDAAATVLRAAGLAVDTAVIEGRPATVIVEEARRFGADLVIVGARGHGTIAEMVLGSVSAEVVDTAPVPVLIARARDLERIVLAWDGSPAAERAASLLETWPIFAGASVRVVTAAETPAVWWAGIGEPAAPIVVPEFLEAIDEARRESRRLAESMAERLRAAGLRAEAEAREGPAAQELLAAAAAWDARLIVMGHSRTGLARLALGSVARNVVHHARASVLVVREPAGGGGEHRGS